MSSRRSRSRSPRRRDQRDRDEKRRAISRSPHRSQGSGSTKRTDRRGREDRDRDRDRRESERQERDRRDRDRRERERQERDRDRDRDRRESERQERDRRDRDRRGRDRDTDRRGRERERTDRDRQRDFEIERERRRRQEEDRQRESEIRDRQEREINEIRERAIRRRQEELQREQPPPRQTQAPISGYDFVNNLSSESSSDDDGLPEGQDVSETVSGYSSREYGDIAGVANIISQRSIQTALGSALRLSRSIGQEIGGFIYYDPSDGTYTITSNLVGESNSIDLSAPPRVPGMLLIANFHTHPNDREPEPSGEDVFLARQRNTPGIVISTNGRIYNTGPQIRPREGNLNQYPNPDPARGYRTEDHVAPRRGEGYEEIGTHDV